MTFPYTTMSSWFAEHGDFEENLPAFDYEHTHQSVRDGSPAMLVSETEDTITLVNEDGYQWTDPKQNWVSPTVDEPVCEVCQEPNPVRTKDEHGTLMCESCLDDAVIDPCCYNAYRNFGGGNGPHEWGCLNY